MEVFGLGHEFIIALAAFLLFFHFGMRYLITYHLTDIRLEVRLFWFLPVSRTRYDLVDEVRINDYLKAFFWPLLWVWMINSVPWPRIGLSGKVFSCVLEYRTSTRGPLFIQSLSTLDK